MQKLVATDNKAEMADNWPRSIRLRRLFALSSSISFPYSRKGQREDDQGHEHDKDSELDG